jgi:hypothetical protein
MTQLTAALRPFFTDAAGRVLLLITASPDAADAAQTSQVRVDARGIKKSHGLVIRLMPGISMIFDRAILFIPAARKMIIFCLSIKNLLQFVFVCFLLFIFFGRNFFSDCLQALEEGVTVAGRAMAAKAVVELTPPPPPPTKFLRVGGGKGGGKGVGGGASASAAGGEC